MSSIRFAAFHPVTAKEFRASNASGISGIGESSCSCGILRVKLCCMPLKIDRVESGHRLAIRPEKSLQNWIVLALQLMGLCAFIFGFSVNMKPGDQVGILLFALIPLYFWLRFWFGQDVITVSKTSFMREASLFDISWSSSEYTNTSVKRLRYAEWKGARAGTQSGICFEYEGLDVVFARQASSTDCYDLLDRMRQEFPFREDMKDQEAPSI